VLAHAIKLKAEFDIQLGDGMKTRSRRKIPDGQLQKLARRLLQSHNPKIETPVIISTREGEYVSSVGRLLGRIHGRVSALVDHALEHDRAVTVFLPENAYVAEVVKCVAEGKQFVVELLLIQYQDT
jgi:hypothetical protein